MSVTCSVMLVDWTEFQDFLTERRDFRRIADFFAEERLSDDVAYRGQELLERLEECCGNWNSPSRNAFETVFRSLFCGLCEENVERYRILEVTLDRGNGCPYVELAWSPATVRRMAQLWRSVDMKECEEVFVPTRRDDEPFAEFAEFKSYVDEWAEILRVGAEYGFGLVKCIWV